MKSYISAVLVLALLAALPASARDKTVDRLFLPAAKPTAPAETVACKDQPLDLRDAKGDLLDHLRRFDYPPQDFEYTIQLVAEEEQFRVYRVTYTSPFDTPWPENNTVPAEYYVPRGEASDQEKKYPAAIVLDIMDGSAILPRMMARSAAQNGVVALYIPMPCYNDRRPPGDPHEDLLRENPAHAADGLRQTVFDVRRAKAILASRPEVDASRVGITGISLGGIMTSLAAGVDGTFARVCPILAGGDVATITFHANESRKLRRAMQEKGITRDYAAEHIFGPVDPVTFASRIGAERCLMINASKDEVIPKATTLALNEAAGKPPIVWISGTHYSAVGYFPVMQKTVIEFLRDGTRPESAK